MSGHEESTKDHTASMSNEAQGLIARLKGGKGGRPAGKDRVTRRNHPLSWAAAAWREMAVN